MLTILNAIELSADYLHQKGIESARINAELLLSHILQCKRMDLYLKFDQPLSEKEKIDYREFIRRRGKREPLQYITGSVEFFGLEFEINKKVLIPRQETEILVEEVLKNINGKSSTKILDIGTGSGNIAISLVKNSENCEVHSIDISEAAVNQAKRNAEKHNINGELKIENIEIEKFMVNNDLKFDMIVSNPPYISAHDYESLEQELIDHEPRNALTDDDDGLSFYRVISKKSKSLLLKGGSLFFEIGYGQSSHVIDVMKNNGFINIKIKKDFQNIDRVISGTLT